MSAVRMVAYGVLELKEVAFEPAHMFRSPITGEVSTPPLDTKSQFENDQLRKLVNDELHSYGLLLKRNIVPKGQGWRTKNKEHILLGQLVPPNAVSAWRTREELCVGTFKECCIRAAEVLDAMERGQKPEE